MRKTLLWMTLILAGGCAGAQKPAEEGAAAGKAGTVAFKFDWPDQMRMNVGLVKDRAVRSDGNIMAWKGATSFDLVTERQEDGIYVRSENFTWQGGPIPEQPGAAIREVLQRTAITGQPSFVAADVGDLLRVEGVSEILAAQAATAGVDLSVIPEEQLAQIRPQIEQAIQSSARDLWQNMIGFWAGRELNIGQPVKRRSSTTLAALGNRSVTQYLNYQVLGRVPCNVEVPVPDATSLAQQGMPAPAQEVIPDESGMEPGMEGEAAPEAGMEPGMEGEAAPEAGMEPGMEGEAAPEAGMEPGMEGEAAPEAGMETTPEAGVAAGGTEGEAEAGPTWTPADEIPGLGQGQCVWIELNSQYDPAAVQAAIENQPENAAGPRFQNLENDIRVILVTDPDGLKPHHLVRVQSAEVEVMGPDGTPQSQAEENVSAWTFEYPAAAE